MSSNRKIILQRLPIAGERSAGRGGWVRQSAAGSGRWGERVGREACVETWQDSAALVEGLTSEGGLVLLSFCSVCRFETTP